jgi:hypothetical protein
VSALKADQPRSDEHESAFLPDPKIDEDGTNDSSTDSHPQRVQTKNCFAKVGGTGLKAVQNLSHRGNELCAPVLHRSLLLAANQLVTHCTGEFDSISTTSIQKGRRIH